jgi:very-short-patch-repair endonuclease
LKFRRQQPIGGFIVDFCCFEAKLSIELDGGEHGEDRQANYDRERTAVLDRMGIRELRFWNTAIFENLSGVLATIEAELEGRPLTHRSAVTPPTRGEVKEMDPGL